MNHPKLVAFPKKQTAEYAKHAENRILSSALSAYSAYSAVPSVLALIAASLLCVPSRPVLQSPPDFGLRTLDFGLRTSDF